jgi:hypothetical protein
MTKVFHRDNPRVVLYDGDDPEGFIAQNEPRPHVQDGVAMPQLVTEESKDKEAE